MIQQRMKLKLWKTMDTLAKGLNRVHSSKLNKNTEYSHTNIFHCCTWKTASQWMKRLLEHNYLSTIHGLTEYTYADYHSTYLKFGQAKTNRPYELNKLLIALDGQRTLPVPHNSFFSTFYLSYKAYQAIPKQETYKSFFVLRDPRDVVVSWYFSMLKTHTPFPWILEWRDKLTKLDISDGFMFSIDTLEREGVFDCMCSWIENGPKDPCVKIFRYEALADHSSRFIDDLLAWLDIELPLWQRIHLHSLFSFSRIAGRKQGSENRSSHMRRGITNDWINHLDNRHIEHLESVSPNLIEIIEDFCEINQDTKGGSYV